MSDSDSRPDADDQVVEDQNGDDQDHTARPPPRKRRRLVISCTECHRRKQKCDRGLPCANCISRGKESACRYETGKPVVKPTRSPPEGRAHHEQPEPLSRVPQPVDLGYTHNGASTLDVLQRIESASDGERLASLAAEQGASTAGVRERYKALIRQLPARTYVEDLVDFYFEDVNWQYFGVDEFMFRDLLTKWYNVPFSVFATVGPQGLEPMLREFPALVFQLAACSLLYLRDNLLEKFSALKYADMTFDDLAMDYSESGASILSLLGKRQMTLIAPLAGWVRAKFLKHCGAVTESWHQLGTALRDAQEIGMHRDEKDPRPRPNDSVEQSLEKLWMGQARRRVWLLLLSWEIHMGAVLGRTPQCDFSSVSLTIPLDVIQSKEGHKAPLIPRPENSPPTPLTRTIWMWMLVKPLKDIVDLEKNGPFPKDFSHIDRIEQSLTDIEARLPAAFRMNNPDTRYDHLPECWWLPLVRPTLPQVLYFGRLALHRPYIFTRAASRLEALKASFGMLDAQRRYFAVLNPTHHRMFSLFYGTFDAVVMVSSIYILFPREHSEYFAEALQHFQWASERFEKMSSRNQLARSALSVLNALYMRLKRVGEAQGRLNAGESPSTQYAAVSTVSNSDNTPASVASSTDVGAVRHPSLAQSSASTNGTNGSVADGTIPTPGSSIHNYSMNSVDSKAGKAQEYSSNNSTNGAGGTSAVSNMFTNSDWVLPPNFDMSSIMPMYPIGDLAMNDLTGMFGDLHDTAGLSANAAASAISWIDINSGNTNNNIMPMAHQVFAASTDAIAGAPDAKAELVGNSLVNTGSYETGISGHPSQGKYNPQGGDGGGGGDAPWQFGGDFGNDTIWNLFNQISYPHPHPAAS